MANNAGQKAIEALSAFLSKSPSPDYTVALLLDYDGTLSPISPRPEMATMPEETRRVMEDLRQRKDVFMAIISGRGLGDLKSMVKMEGLTFGGNHGLEIQHADGGHYVYPMPDEMLQSLQKMIRELKAEVCKDGAWVEDKHFQMTLHYRQMADHLRPALETNAAAIIEKHGFRVERAHCALECKPKVDWNKGKAAAYILEKEFGPQWEKRVRAISVGDDTTDEDMFRRFKGKGFGIRIGEEGMSTEADVLIPSTEAFVDILKYIQARK